jgi:hypothetical protein
LSVTARHNAKLFAISTNYTDLRITDFSIKSDMRSRFVTDDSSFLLNLNDMIISKTTLKYKGKTVVLDAF